MFLNILNFDPLILLGIFSLIKNFKLIFENFICDHLTYIIFTPLSFPPNYSCYICMFIQLVESIQSCVLMCAYMWRADYLGLDNHEGLIPGGKCFSFSQQPLLTCSSSCMGGFVWNLLCPPSPESCLPTPSLNPRLSIYLKSIHNKLQKSLLHNLPLLLSLLRRHSVKC